MQPTPDQYHKIYSELRTRFEDLRSNPEKLLGSNSGTNFFGGYYLFSLISVGTGYAMGGFKIPFLAQRNGSYKIFKILAPNSKKLSQQPDSETALAMLEQSGLTENIYDYSNLEAVLYNQGSIEQFVENHRFIHDILFDTEMIISGYYFKHNDLYFTFEDVAFSDLDQLLHGNCYKVDRSGLSITPLMTANLPDNVLNNFEPTSEVAENWKELLRNKTPEYLPFDVGLEYNEVMATKLRLKAQYKRKIANEIILSVYNLHKFGITHGDLKSNNVLIFNTPLGLTAKISDLDLVVAGGYEQIKQFHKNGGALGHLATSANHFIQNPDSTTNYKPKTHICDISSLGKILFEICTEKRFYEVIKEDIPQPENVSYREYIRWLNREKNNEMLEIAKHELHKCDFDDLYKRAAFFYLRENPDEDKSKNILIEKIEEINLARKLDTIEFFRSGYTDISHFWLNDSARLMPKIHIFSPASLISIGVVVHLIYSLVK